MTCTAIYLFNVLILHTAIAISSIKLVIVIAKAYGIAVSNRCHVRNTCSVNVKGHRTGIIFPTFTSTKKVRHYASSFYKAWQMGGINMLHKYNLQNNMICCWRLERIYEKNSQGFPRIPMIIQIILIPTATLAYLHGQLGITGDSKVMIRAV